MYGWLNAHASDPTDPRSFVVDACADCGHGLLRDVPDASPAELHESGSYESARPRGAGLAAPVLRLFDRAKLRLLQSEVPTGSAVLEVGAGRGRFLRFLSASGYRATGLEPARHRAEGARASGAEVLEATIEEADVEPGSVDAVVAWHVIEHTRDPDLALERIAGWLRPGGAVLLGIPNKASWQAGLGGGRWFHLDLPRHVSHFTPRSLELHLVRHGFRIVAVRHRLAEHNPFGMWQTLVNTLTFHPNVLFGALKRSIRPRGAADRVKVMLDLLITVIAALPALILALPLEAVAGAARRGGTIAVLAVHLGTADEAQGARAMTEASSSAPS